MKKLFPETKMIAQAKQQSKGHIFIVEILLFAAVFLVVEIVSNIPAIAVESVKMLTSQQVLDAVARYNSGEISLDEYTDIVTSVIYNSPMILLVLFTTGIATILTIVYCRFIEKRRLSTMGFVKKDAFAEYGVGMLIGTGLFSVAVGICVLTGAVIPSKVPDIAWGMIGLYFVGYLIQGMSEETLCRGYFMVSLSRRSHVVVAVVISSSAFAAAHLANNGISVLAMVNLVLFGVFASCYVLKRGSLWGVCAIHSLWNFVQGNFFGISVSGFPDSESIFRMTSVGSKTLINGGDFGLEGGLAVTAVLVASIIAISLTKTKQCELAEEMPPESTVESEETEEPPADV